MATATITPWARATLKTQQTPDVPNHPFGSTLHPGRGSEAPSRVVGQRVPSAHCSPTVPTLLVAGAKVLQPCRMGRDRQGSACSSTFSTPSATEHNQRSQPGHLLRRGAGRCFAPTAGCSPISPGCR